MAEQYSIKSRSHQCHVTGEDFEEGQPFIAAIFPDPESSGYVRQDFSLPSWEKRESDAEVPFSFWRSTYKPPEKEEKIEVTPHDPESLFQKLVEEDEDHTENARFILAAMLERKKLLRETDTQRTGTGLLRIYEHRQSGDVFIVKDPQIPLDEVETIQDEVQELLDPDYKAAKEAEAAAAAAAEAEEVEGETETGSEEPSEPEAEEAQPVEA